MTVDIDAEKGNDVPKRGQMIEAEESRNQQRKDDLFNCYEYAFLTL